MPVYNLARVLIVSALISGSVGAGQLVSRIDDYMNTSVSAGRFSGAVVVVVLSNYSFAPVDDIESELAAIVFKG